MSLLLPTNSNTVVPHVDNISAVSFFNLIKIFVRGFFFENTSLGLSHSDHLNAILILVANCFKAVYPKLLLWVCFTFEGISDSIVSVPNTALNFYQWASLDLSWVGDEFAQRWWMHAWDSFMTWKVICIMYLYWNVF